MTELDQRQAVESQKILDLLFSYMPKIAAERKMDHLLVLMADLGRSIVSADRCSQAGVLDHRDHLRCDHRAEYRALHSHDEGDCDFDQ